MMHGTHVVVVGAGTGGAAAALLMAAGGARVTLLERVREPRAVGAGILLQPNGFAVLYALGLGDRLKHRGFKAREVPIRDGRGRLLHETQLPDFGSGLDHALVLRRSHLLEVLQDALQDEPRIDVKLGTEVVGATAAGAVAYRMTGANAGDATRSMTADLVIGADGVHSRVRECGAFGARVTRTGVSYVRGLSPAPAPDDAVGEAWTPLGLFGIAPLDAGSYFFTSAVAPSIAAALAGRDLDRFRAAWRRAYPASALVLSPLQRFDDLLVNEVIRVDCDRWVDGTLVLLGDAAHAMAPNLGQGANSALVDAAVLALELRRDGRLEEDLARYERRRRPAVRQIQDLAGRLTRLGDVRTAPLRRLRDDAMRMLGPIIAGESSVRRTQQEDPAELFAAVRSFVGSQA